MPDSSQQSTLALETQLARRYAGGFWMLVNIKPWKVNIKLVHLNISLLENLPRDIDHYAKLTHLTRSGFLAQAAIEAMAE